MKTINVPVKVDCLTWKDVIVLMAKELGIHSSEIPGFSVYVNYETQVVKVYRRVDEIEYVFSFTESNIQIGFFDPKEMTMNMALAMPVSLVPHEGLSLDMDGDTFDVVLIGDTMSSQRFPLTTLPKIKMEIH